MYTSYKQRDDVPRRKTKIGDNVVYVVGNLPNLNGGRVEVIETCEQCRFHSALFLLCW
jgi:hypothetical protein